MDRNSNKLYFPLFYKYASLLGRLRHDELGALVYNILISGGTVPPKEPLASNLEIIYNLIVSDASRLFERNFGKCNPKNKEKAKKERFGSFDIDDAFERALERSYGKRE